MADIAAVLKELQEERGRLDEAIEALGKVVGQNHRGPIQTRVKRPRRAMSVAARRKISLAQKARWAKTRRATASTTVRTMSQAARNRIAAAQRARWAKTRAQQKKAA